MEERVSRLEDRTVEFIQSKKQKEKRIKKSDDSLRDLLKEERERKVQR